MYTPAPPTNGLAVTSLVLGIVGLCTYGVPGILALIFGIVAMRQIKQKNQGGHGLAVAGIALGAISMAFGLMFLIFFVVVGWF